MNRLLNGSLLSFVKKGNIEHIDAEIIIGLKSSNPSIRDFYVNRLFYKELKGLLNTIQYSLYKGTVEYDELVNELYIYLSRNNWAALDSYRGDNRARLSSWLSKVAWHFFMYNHNRNTRVQTDSECLVVEMQKHSVISDDDIRMDVEDVLKRMPNRRYAEVLRLNLYYGYSAEDISVILDTTVSNVYNIKHRAIMQFISIYGQRNEV